MTREEYLFHKGKRYTCVINDDEGEPTLGYGTVCGYVHDYLIVGFDSDYAGCVKSFTKFVHMDSNDFKSYRFINVNKVTKTKA